MSIQPIPTVGRSPGFLRSWVLWVSLGESLGFLAPALLQPLAGRLTAGMALAVLVAAGAVEGAVLGWAQALVLTRRLPALSSRRWIAGTAAAGALAWLIGMSVSTFVPVWHQWPVPGQVAAGTAAGAILLCSIGAAQWLELRHHLPRSRRWIAGTALAWAAGLLVFLGVSTPLWQPGQPTWLVILIGMVAAVLMAVSMAWVTGWVMARLLARLPPEQAYHGPAHHVGGH